MKTLISKLVLPAYLAGIAFAGYSAVSLYFFASSVMKDHTVVEAPIELVNTTSRTKRGHTSVTYHFNYHYIVGGAEYSSDYSAVNEKGEAYLEREAITVAYSNADPAKVGPLHVLSRQSSLWEMTKGFLLFSAILSVLALFVYGWAVGDREDEDADEPLDSAATSKAGS